MCEFALPAFSPPILSPFALPTLPSPPAVPDLTVAIPDMPTFAPQVPLFALPVMGLPLLPSPPAVPDFAIDVPGFALDLKLPAFSPPILLGFAGLSLPTPPAIPAFTIPCPLDA